MAEEPQASKSGTTPKSAAESAACAQKPDVVALMRTIRERVLKEMESGKDKRLPFQPRPADPNDPTASRKAGELLGSEELRYLNANHAHSYTLDTSWISSHRPGVLGKLIVKLKRKIFTYVWDNFIRHYYAREREYNVNLVRFLNEACHYIDGRDAAIFWELIRKIDVDVTRALERIERIADEQTATLRSTEKQLLEELNNTARDLSERIAALATKSHEQQDRLKTLNNVALGLEGIVAQWGEKARTPQAPGVQEVPPQYSYLLLENRYRGGEEEISARLKVYPQIFQGAKLPILDMGCGRGELLVRFREAGIDAYGAELDRAMCEIARTRGVRVEEANALVHLASLPDGSLGGLVAIQVVEHLSHEQLRLLLELCRKKVAQGGRIALETINPTSLLALSSQYCRDPTHVSPLHPDTLAYAMSLAGLRVLETHRLSPVQPEAKLQLLPVEDFMTPRWAFTLERINANIRQLNAFLYGDQDYCVVAEVR